MTIDEIVTVALEESFQAKSPIITRFVELLRTEEQSTICDAFARVLHPTISLDVEHAFLLYNAYYIFQWVDLLKKLQFPVDGMLLEVASGGGTILPEALTQLQQSGSEYIAFNENTLLTNQFKRETASLTLPISVIEDSGMAISNYFLDNSGDIVAFHHGLNDIIQAIIAEQQGIDTVHENWWGILTKMVDLTVEAFEQKRLKALVVDELFELFEAAYHYVKPHGYLIFNNHMFTMDIEAGYSPELYSRFIPLFREWISDMSLPFRELIVPGYPEQWWLILQKTSA